MYYLIFILICSLVVGTFAAIYHTRIKRVLVFSSLYNSGFFLAAFTVQPTANASFSFLFFLSVYLLTMLGVAGVLFNLVERGSSTYLKKVEDLSAIRTNNNALMFVFVILVLSLAGIPPMSVFYSKLLI